MNPITKELLEKYNIREYPQEIFHMDGIGKTLFIMWPMKDGEWMYDYLSVDESVIARTKIKTEDELITALKFSKLI